MAKRDYIDEQIQKEKEKKEKEFNDFLDELAGNTSTTVNEESKSENLNSEVTYNELDSDTDIENEDDIITEDDITIEVDNDNINKEDNNFDYLTDFNKKYNNSFKEPAGVEKPGYLFDFENVSDSLKIKINESLINLDLYKKYMALKYFLNGKIKVADVDLWFEYFEIRFKNKHLNVNGKTKFFDNSDVTRFFFDNNLYVYNNAINCYAKKYCSIHIMKESTFFDNFNYEDEKFIKFCNDYNKKYEKFKAKHTKMAITKSKYLIFYLFVFGFAALLFFKFTENKNNYTNNYSDEKIDLPERSYEELEKIYVPNHNTLIFKYDNTIKTYNNAEYKKTYNGYKITCYIPDSFIVSKEVFLNVNKVDEIEIIKNNDE